MKKTVFIFLGLFLLSAAQAEAQAALQPVVSNRALPRQKWEERLNASVRLYQEDQFGNTPVFAAALKGNVRELQLLKSMARNGSYLLLIGKDGNNVFHVARDLKTFDVLVESIRHFYPEDYRIRINLLLQQKNNLKETPLRAQLNYGRTDIFLKYFPHTPLYKRMQRVQTKLFQGGLVAQVAQDEQEDIVADCKDSSGVSLAQAVRNRAKELGMRAVAELFREQFPSF